MTHTDPQVVIKQIDPELRKEFFSAWPAFDKLDWSKLNKKRKVDSLLDCLKSQTDSDQREITYLLGLFSSLKSDDGLRILLEEIQVKNPDILDGWGSAGSKIDKVVFAYLHAKEAFERAVIFEEADSCSRRQGWNTWAGVKCEKFNADKEHIDKLKEMLIGYHENEFRGKQCKINHYSRANGAEYIFAYLPNWPGNHVVFSESGDLESLKLPMAFSILFVYTPKSGQFAMIASGGKKKQGDLRSIFYQALTDTSVDDLTPNRRAFEMDRVLEDEFRFNQHDIAGVEKVEVASLAWSSNSEDADISWSSLRFRSGLKWKENLDILDRSLVGCGHDRTRIEIQSLHVQFYFTGKTHRALIIKITPQTCTIKSVKCEERRTMMEQCVTQWGFEDDGSLNLIWAVLDSPEPIIANAAWQRLSEGDRESLDGLGLLERHTLNEIQCPVCSDGHRSPVQETDCPLGETQYSIECPEELRIIIEHEQRVTRRIQPKRVAESIASSLNLTGVVRSVSGDQLYFCGYHEYRKMRIEVYFARGFRESDGEDLAKLIPHSILPKVVYTPMFRTDHCSLDQEIPLSVIPLQSAACLDEGVLVVDFALFESIAQSLVQQIAHPDFMFARCGDYWDICFEGRDVSHVKDSVGMIYLARVLHEPHKSLPVVALLAARVGIDEAFMRGTSGLRIDEQANSSYKGEYEILMESRGIAEQTNDDAALERVTEQLKALAGAFSQSLNLGGKSREDSDHEKVRVSVANAINRSVNHIQKHDPELGRHLKSCIQTGSDVIYTPEREIDWVI